MIKNRFIFIIYFIRFLPGLNESSGAGETNFLTYQKKVKGAESGGLVIFKKYLLFKNRYHFISILFGTKN